MSAPLVFFRLCRNAFDEPVALLARLPAPGENQTLKLFAMSISRLDIALQELRRDKLQDTPDYATYAKANAYLTRAYMALRQGRDLCHLPLFYAGCPTAGLFRPLIPS